MEKLFIVGSNVIMKGNKFLLVQETLKVTRGKWNIPGGRIDAGEDITACAKREAKEETGFIVRPTSLVGIYQYPVLWRHNAFIFVFRSKITGGKLKIPHDAMDVRWFSFDEIKVLNKKGLLMVPHVWESIRDFKAGKSHPFSFIRILKSV